jgi:hypothetical protein
LSRRRFLLGRRINGRPADVATSTVVMLALGVLPPFPLSGRPGDTCIILVVLVLTGLAIGRLRSFRLRGGTSDAVTRSRPRVRSRRGRL